MVTAYVIATMRCDGSYVTQVAVRIADREAEALQEAGLVGFGAGGGGAVGRRGTERALRVLPGGFRRPTIGAQCSIHACISTPADMMPRRDAANQTAHRGAEVSNCWETLHQLTAA